MNISQGVYLGLCLQQINTTAQYTLKTAKIIHNIHGSVHQDIIYENDQQNVTV